MPLSSEGQSRDPSTRSVKVGIFDSGAVAPSLDLSVVTHDASGVTGHSNYVAGLLADHAGRHGARVALHSFDWTGSLAELRTWATVLDVSVHAYGSTVGWSTSASCPSLPMWFGGSSYHDPRIGELRWEAEFVDEIIRRTGHLAIIAAGNSRTRSDEPSPDHYHFPSCTLSFADSHAPQHSRSALAGAALSANALTVGAYMEGPARTAAEVVWSSAIGPTGDGRLKPDVVARGWRIASAVEMERHEWWSGTSVAAAIAGGDAVALLALGRGRAAEQDLTALEVKALLVNTAGDLGLPGPDYESGHGAIDVEAAAELLRAEDDLPDGMSRLRVSSVSSVLELRTGRVRRGRPLSFTVVRNSVPAAADGAAAPGSHLHLELRSPDGAASFFPWSLNPLRTSERAIRSDPNAVDNVQRVTVYGHENVWEGAWTVRIARGSSACGPDAVPFAVAGAVPLEAPPVDVLRLPRSVTLRGAARHTFELPLHTTLGQPVVVDVAASSDWLAVPRGALVAPAVLDVEVDGSAALASGGVGNIRVSTVPRGLAPFEEIGVRVVEDCPLASGERTCGMSPACGLVHGTCDTGMACAPSGTCALGWRSCPFADVGSNLGPDLARFDTTGHLDLHSGRCGGEGSPDVGVRWTAPVDGWYGFSAREPSFDAVVSVRQDDCRGAELACDDDSLDNGDQSVVFLRRGESVIVVIDGYTRGEHGEAALSVTAERCPSESLGSALGSLAVADLLRGRKGHLAGSCGGAGPEAAFAWRAPHAGTYAFAAEAFGHSPTLYVRSGDCAGRELACGHSPLLIQLDAGQDITLVVDSDKPSPGAFRVLIHAVSEGASEHLQCGAGFSIRSDCGGAFQIENGLPCDDGDRCTFDDVCIDGRCLGHPVECNDGSTLTGDACDSSSGKCAHHELGSIKRRHK